MAEITVESKWWSDPRRMRLCEELGHRIADGLAVELWMMAKHYAEQNQCIPYPEFEALEHFGTLVRSGLVEYVQGDRIYVRGSRKYFPKGLSLLVSPRGE